MEREALGSNNSGGGGKRKIADDEIEMAKQKAQAIAARILNDADAKRPRTEPSPPSGFSSQPSFPVSYANQSSQYNGVPSSKKIMIPNGKVGVIIGRGGDMIKNLQQRSGARIQITRDAEADPSSLTRDVELMGTQEQISRAEELINEVIAETDAASSGSSGGRDVAPLHPGPGGEQFVMKVPNDRVALVIGKGGETIKTMQGKTGARIQVVPLRLPPGDTSTERNVYISGTPEQIEAAKELVNEVISGNRMKVMSGGNTYGQSAYPPSSGWSAQGQPPTQQPAAYGYAQPGGYAMPPPPPYYGGYPTQQTGWEQQQQASPAAGAQPQQQNTGYNAYGQQQAPATSAPANANYSYNQMPPASGYNYSQGYPQQPQSYAQDISGQAPAPDHSKSYANPNPASYGPPPTSTQPDGASATQPPQPGYGPPPTTQTSYPGYGPPASQTAQSGHATPPAAQAPYAGYGAPPPQTSQPGYGTPTSQPGYGTTPPPQTSQPPAAANGYGAYPSYSGAPPVQPAYSSAAYAQTGYGQQQDNQAAYSYYGQGGYPPQTGYYQGGYPPVPPQNEGQPTNGVPPSSNYGADGGDSAAGTGAADESAKPQS